MQEPDYKKEYARPLPTESFLVSSYENAYLADAYSINLPLNASKDPETITRLIFANQPFWSRALMSARDFIV